MEKIITNEYNLKEEDVTEVVKRVKLLIINDKNEVLLGYSDHEYQCPGGHVEDGEDFVTTINREIQEETGIELNLDKADPFACSIGYYKDWPEKGKNRKIEIYYYEIKTNEKPNLENTNYTKSELEKDFKLEYIPLDKVEEVFINNANIYSDEHGIAKEMLKVFKVYKSTLKH